MEKPALSTSKHLIPLDVLRGVAVLLVLGRHFPLITPYESSVWLLPLTLWRRMGWTGVDLFFVLSGFLVSGLLFREFQSCGSIKLSLFYIRRGIRVYIPFYVYLLLSGPLRLENLYPERIATEVFFLQSYFPKWAIWNHTWTLAVEEHFYFFLGLIVFILSRQKRTKDPFRLFVLIWSFLGFGCLMMRIGTPYDAPLILTASHMRFDALFFGVLISYFYHFHRGSFLDFVTRFRGLLLALSIAAFLPVFAKGSFQRPWMTRFGFTCTYLAAGGFLSLCLTDKIGKEISRLGGPTKAVAAIGRISYSVYLWHIVVSVVLIEVFPKEPSVLGMWACLGMYLLLAIGAGWVSYRLIERPSLAWRDRRFPARD
jgi:peptidoglycan/LPS O-acetylase OafA/YrhL